MQKLGVVLLLALCACSTPPTKAQPEVVPPPVVAPKPPTEPFGALLEAKKSPGALDIDGNERVTRQKFKDHFLHAFSAADRLDGRMDGSAPIAESCKQLLGLCHSADADGDGKLSLKEFLDRLDQLFDRADRNHDHVLSRREIEKFVSGY